MKGITVVSIAVFMALGGISGSAARAEQLVDVTLPEYTGIPRPPLQPWTGGPIIRGNVILRDDFNRPDGPLGPNWTAQASTFAIFSQAARGGPGPAAALTTHNTGTGDVIEMDIAHGGGGVQYAAAVLNYGGGVNNIFIKVQDNGNGTRFDFGGCYRGNNVNGFGLGFFALTAPFMTAHMRVEVNAARTVTIDFTNVDGGGGAPQQYVCTLAPPAEGPAVGMGGYAAQATIDNFSSGTVPVELMGISVE
jgi:hypothetical protein